MEQLKLGNGNLYDLVTNVILELADERLKIIVGADYKTFADIESDFGSEVNTRRMEVLDIIGETVNVEQNYYILKSITKENDYITGREEYTDENGETAYRDVKKTVYIITLMRPDLHDQVKILQETVDLLVLEGLGV